MDKTKETSEMVEKFKQMPLVAWALNELKDNVANLPFHNLGHSEDVLHEAILFGIHGKLRPRTLELLAIAAAYHDIGFVNGDKEGHELRSIVLAGAKMKEVGGYKKEEVAVVCKAIMDTQLLQAGDRFYRNNHGSLSAYLQDADLSNLGRTDFMEKLQLWQDEYHWTREESLQRALGIMQSHCWFTQAARRLREKTKQANMVAIRAILRIT